MRRLKISISTFQNLNNSLLDLPNFEEIDRARRALDGMNISDKLAKSLSGFSGAINHSNITEIGRLAETVTAITNSGKLAESLNQIVNQPIFRKSLNDYQDIESSHYHDDDATECLEESIQSFLDTLPENSKLTKQQINTFVTLLCVLIIFIINANSLYEQGKELEAKDFAILVLQLLPTLILYFNSNKD